MLSMIEFSGYPSRYLVIARKGGSQQGRRDALLDTPTVLPLTRSPFQAPVPQLLVAGDGTARCTKVGWARGAVAA